MDSAQLRRIIEGALLAAGRPLDVGALMSLFGLEGAQPTREEVRAALEDIATDCRGRGYELVQVASGWRLQVCSDLAPWIARLWEERPQRYSRAVLETLSIIAYRQPVTRGEIEEIRGVAVNTNIIRLLSEREWIRVVGHRDVPGKPALYATTRQFLDYFNLRRLEDLPPLSELRDLASLDPDLALELELKSAEGEPTGEQDEIADQAGLDEVELEEVGRDEVAVDEPVGEMDAAAEEAAREEEPDLRP